MSLIALETNIYPILNLEELSAQYRLYRIRGLRADQDEYYQNRQILTKRLSYALKSPVLTTSRGDDTYLIVRDGTGPLPPKYQLIRAQVRFEPASEVLDLDFTKREHENDLVCIRFLQFALQESLYQHDSLWQPSSGRPFFEYRPQIIDGNVCHYRGFSIRVCPTASGGIGIVLEVATTAVSKTPLPAKMARESFRAWQSKNAIYHYGHQWYEIQLSALEDLTCGEHELQDEGEWINLKEFAIRKSRKPVPHELLAVGLDDSVVQYSNNQNQRRHAIARLCYPVIGTDASDAAANLHRESILSPDTRRNIIHQFAQTYLPLLRFGKTPLAVAANPDQADVRMFNVPDQTFGHGKTISTIGTPGAIQVSLDHLGQTRKALLRDSTAGFFTRTPLDRQYIVLPQSVSRSYGPAFIRDLTREVGQLYPEGGTYQPEVITYDDSGKPTFTAQGAAVLKAIETAGVEPGYALVMVHHVIDRPIRQEDPLAGMLTQELHDRFDLTAAVIHTKVSRSGYIERQLPNGTRFFEIDQKKRGMITGYLRTVALSKVLLTNQKWPFVLQTKLHADITIGIDIKQNTAGFVVVSAGGKHISTLVRTSRQKECLMKDQMRDYLIELITKEASLQTDLIRTIVIHRDGRSFESEQAGTEAALQTLKTQGVVDAQATVTILEIPKASPIRLRLFDVTKDDTRDRVDNPQIGCYYIIDENLAYVCATGRAFPHEGTTRPLAVRRVSGELGMVDCLSDLYALTTLAWTKPDDCSRYPITLKLCDRYLTEDATDYDEDALRRAEVLSELEVEVDDA